MSRGIWGDTLTVKGVFACMKKRILGTIVFFLTMVLFLPLAHAEEMKVSVTVLPTELSDTGDVTFTFEIANYSIYEMSDITINLLGADHMVPLEQPIPPNGSARDIRITASVPESQLGTAIPITVTSIRSGEPVSVTTQATVNRASDPVITVTRTADKQTGKEGDVVTLTYKLANETKFDMTGITVIDENVSDDVILTQSLLRASDSITIDRKYTLGTDSVVSAPIVTYTVNGKTKTFSAVEQMTLTVVLVRMEMNVTMGTPTKDGVGFTLELKNTGNQDINAITVTDDKGAAVTASPVSLKAGESNTTTYQVVPLMTEPLRNVVFTLKGTDALGGEYSLVSTGTYEVYPYVDDSQISVSMTAETVTPWAAETGKLTARVIVTNHSLVDLSNVTVSEANLGTLKTFDTLPAGESSFDQEVTLGSPRNLQFSIKGTDPAGSVRELTNCILPVAYGTEEAVVETPAPQTSTNNTQIFGFLNSTVSRILLILGILMVGAFIVLIVLSVMERSKSGALIRFDEEEDDEEDGELDSIFRNEPIDDWQQREEERSYTQRMTARTAKLQEQPPRTGGAYQRGYPEAQTPPQTPYPPTPPAREPRMVPYEVDDQPTVADYGQRPSAQPYAAQPVQQGVHVQPVQPSVHVQPSAHLQPAEPAYRQPPVYAQPQYVAPPVLEPAYPSQQTESPVYMAPPTQQTPIEPDYAGAAGVRETVFVQNPGQTVYSPSPARLAPRTGRLIPPEQEDAPAKAAPKVIYNKPQPSRVAANRNAVRHVHADKDNKKDG